ncbi:hypothetical protein D9M71_783570 [compost metagenome]
MSTLHRCAGQAVWHIQHLPDQIERRGRQPLLKVQCMGMLHQLPGQLKHETLLAGSGFVAVFQELACHLFGKGCLDVE